MLFRSKLYRQKDPSWVDWARLASKTASTVGGAMSMAPFGITQAFGAALQAPELVWSGLESLNNARENATKEQTDRALTDVDPMGNAVFIPMPMGGLP